MHVLCLLAHSQSVCIGAECSAAPNGTIKRLSHADSTAFCSIFASRAAAFICQLSETIARTCRVASRRIVRFDLSRQPFRRNDEIALFGRSSH